MRTNVRLRGIVCVLFIVLGFYTMKGQSFYYYYNNQKIDVSLDKEYISVSSLTEKCFLESDSLNIKQRTQFSKNDNIRMLQSNLGNVNTDIYYCEVQLKGATFNNASNYLNFIDKLNKRTSILKVSPCFKTTSGAKLGLTNYFYVKIKPQGKRTLYSYAEKNKVKVISQVPYMKEWYILSCTKDNVKNSLELANQFYESGLFATAEPEFVYHNLLLSNDTYFGDQWGLLNIGQHNSNYTGIDIKAYQAWSVSQGNNVKVAIFDHGFEMDHPDLVANVYGNGFDATTGTVPSQVRGDHGTACAGIIGAMGNNNLGIIGVAPKSRLVSISINLLFSDTPLQIASGFNWSCNNGIDVISNSWGGYTPSSIITDAIQNLIDNGRNGKGSIVVFASGNDNDTNIKFPGNSIPEILVVGAMSPCGERKSPLSCDGEGWGGCYGNQLDIVAPGVLIPTADRQGNLGYNYNNKNNDYTNRDFTKKFNGTSSACPHVAGVAALILSVNPNLTGQEVRDIIEKTAQKVRPDLYSYNSDQSHPNGTWNNEMGYGLVDAYAAVRMAKGLVAPADLYVRDSVGDIGDEPSNASRLWASPDIWIEDMAGNRVNPYGDDDYNVCVRIHNRSDNASLGNERLLLNWAKAGIDLNWSGSWTGEEFFICNGKKVPKGGYVGDKDGVVIPSIPAHSNYVIKIKWHVPKPEDYKGCDTTLDKELWHFCLLARIHDGHPILHENESSESVKDLVRDNNNVAWRNVTILEGKQNRGAVSVGNPFKEPRSFSLLYTLFKNEKGELLNKYADVYLNMSSNLFELWQKSDFAGKGFKVVDKNKILLTEPTATIERLVLQPEELYLLEAEVNFFTQENPENNEFVFDIAEYVDDEKGGKELIGGETYIAIRNPERDSYFKAKAVDDKTILPAEPVSFRAEPISEDAVYTWFDQKGDTVARGLNLTVTPTSTQHYKLEVVATADGFKDYDSVRATVRNGAIVSLSPNPTDNQLTITYRLAAGITNATIEISDVQNLSVQSYPVTATATAKTVSLAGLTAGTYVVKLIINGETVDTQQVIKN